MHTRESLMNSVQECAGTSKDKTPACWFAVPAAMLQYRAFLRLHYSNKAENRLHEHIV